MQIFCQAESLVLEKRFFSRAESDRHPAHMDTSRTFPNDPERNKPLALPGKVITVDTTVFSTALIQDILKELSQ